MNLRTATATADRLRAVGAAQQARAARSADPVAARRLARAIGATGVERTVSPLGDGRASRHADVEKVRTKLRAALNGHLARPT